MGGGEVWENCVPLLVERGRLALVRTVFAEDQPSRLQVIVYRVKDGVLTRRESAATHDLMELDTLWLAAANDINTNQAVTLQSGVAGLTMRLWAGGGWHAGADARSPVMPVSMNVNPLVPTGLEVTLQLQGRENSLLKIFLLGAV